MYAFKFHFSDLTKVSIFILYIAFIYGYFCTNLDYYFTLQELRYLSSREKLDDDSLDRFKLLAIAKDFVEINCVGMWNRTPLMLACQKMKSKKLVQCVQTILERPDVKINQTDSCGMNALMYLCRYSRSKTIFEVASLLIGKGININQTDKYGNNALMRLFRRKQIPIDKIVQLAMLLVEKGINKDHKDNYGKDAKHYLIKNKHLIERMERLMLIIGPEQTHP